MLAVVGLLWPFTCCCALCDVQLSQWFSLPWQFVKCENHRPSPLWQSQALMGLAFFFKGGPAKAAPSSSALQVKHGQRIRCKAARFEAKAAVRRSKSRLYLPVYFDSRWSSYCVLLSQPLPSRCWALQTDCRLTVFICIGFVSYFS